MSICSFFFSSVSISCFNSSFSIQYLHSQSPSDDLPRYRTYVLVCQYLTSFVNHRKIFMCLKFRDGRNANDYRPYAKT
nr:MAG TPA: hypothetical protein [Bacteriophage sp.]